MGTLLQLPIVSRKAGEAAAGDHGCEIVIFPGVRIERPDVDLGHRVRDTAGRGQFDSLGGNGRPRRSS